MFSRYFVRMTSAMGYVPYTIRDGFPPYIGSVLTTVLAAVHGGKASDAGLCSELCCCQSLAALSSMDPKTTNVGLCMCECMNVCMHVYMYVCVNVCMYVCMYVC